MNADVIQKIHEAIRTSGNTLQTIPKSSILGFLEKSGIKRSNLEEAYKMLQKLQVAPPSAVPKAKTVASPSLKEHKHDEQGFEDRKTVVDYSDNKLNDVKQRTPRKNVFSEVRKIA